jgi:GrpB-like predicted nucleotidyltransferase (UPF0157 family)
MDTKVLEAGDITTFCDDMGPPDANPFLPGHGPTPEIHLLPYDPSWPARYEQLTELIRTALGDAVISLEHVGSTSVPGLEAKPIIDIDLTVADSNDEDSYIPVLEAHGFSHALREPWWYGHRLLVYPGPRCNLHVWSPDCPEAARHLIFRDWLRSHPEDREAYQQAKHEAARQVTAAGGHVVDYNGHKQDVLREIYGRAFAALGLL